MVEANAGSSFPEPENDFVFDGHITPDLGRLIRQKRKFLGLSLRELSLLLGISWSTLHKWETGQINSCRPQHGSILTSLVSGKLDARLSSAKPHANVPAFTPDQSVLLYVQTRENRAVIAFPARNGTACARAFQSVFNYINDQIEAIHNAATQAPTPSPIAQADLNTSAVIANAPSSPEPADPNSPPASVSKSDQIS